MQTHLSLVEDIGLAVDGSDTSSVSTPSDSAVFEEHNTRNPMFELLFHVQVGGIFQLCVEEIDLARITLSCHCALDLLCDKAGGLTIPFNAELGTIALAPWLKIGRRCLFFTFSLVVTTKWCDIQMVFLSV